MADIVCPVCGGSGERKPLSGAITLDDKLPCPVCGRFEHDWGFETLIHQGVISQLEDIGTGNPGEVFYPDTMEWEPERTNKESVTRCCWICEHFNPIIGTEHGDSCTCNLKHWWWDDEIDYDSLNCKSDFQLKKELRANKGIDIE